MIILHHTLLPIRFGCRTRRTHQTQNLGEFEWRLILRSKFPSSRTIACTSLNSYNLCVVWAWSIHGNECTARIELNRSNVCIQLNNSGDRIAVWTKDNKKYQRELLVFDTCGGVLVHKIACETRIACVACCHGAYYVVGHVNDLICLNADTGTLESTGHHTKRKSNTAIRQIVCFNCVGDRPFSCLSYQSYSEYVGSNSDRLILWDAFTRETVVEFDRGYRRPYFMSFGSTDSIIIGAGVVGARNVTVWELEKCAATGRFQAVVKSQFSLTPIHLRPWCFNPVINALFCGDATGSCRWSYITVLDLGTGDAIPVCCGGIKDPCNPGCGCVHDEEVVLL